MVTVPEKFTNFETNRKIPCRVWARKNISIIHEFFSGKSDTTQCSRSDIFSTGSDFSKHLEPGSASIRIVVVVRQKFLSIKTNVSVYNCTHTKSGFRSRSRPEPGYLAGARAGAVTWARLWLHLKYLFNNFYMEPDII